MLTAHRNVPTQHWSLRLLPLRTLKNARDMLQRFRQVAGLRAYVQARQLPIVAAVLVLVLTSFACVIGELVFLADRHSLLVLLGIVLLPLTLAGSFLVLAYVFFSWIEGRALARELPPRHRQRPGPVAAWLSTKFGLEMGPVPPVPWFLAVLFVVLPLGLLAASWLGAALIVILLAAVLPFAYAKFDV